MHTPQQRRCWRPLFSTLAVAAAVLAAPILRAHAQATPATKPAKPFVPHKETMAEAITQADGITEGVIDHIWVATDESFHHGDYYRIIAELRVCVEADPMFTEAYGDASWLLWSLGDTEGADKLLTYGLTRRPKLWDLQYEFGFHLYNTKRYAPALSHLKAATQIPGADVQSWKMLAHCYDRLGRYADAVATWKTIQKKFPHEITTPHNLASMEAKLKAQRSGGGAKPK